MPEYSVGELVYLDYGEVPQVIHERLVLGHVEGSDHIIATPDRDIYCETLDGANPDVSRIFNGGGRGGLPRGIARANIYGFGVMNAREYRTLLEQGRQELDAERGRRGVPLLGAGMAGDDANGAANAAPAVAPDASEKWVLAEFVPGHKIGEVVILAPDALTDVCHGLHRIVDSDGESHVVKIQKVNESDLDMFCEKRIQLCREAEAARGDDRVAGDDARTLSIKYGLNGERSRTFKDSIQEMRMVEFDDFPFNPRTCMDYVKAIANVAESSLAQHTMWVSQSGIPSGDRAIYEDDCLSRILDLAVKFDGLNVANLASFELLVRRRQLIAEAHAYSPGAPTYEAADHFMQVGHRPGGAIVVPTLTKHVAEKLHQEGQILKVGPPIALFFPPMTRASSVFRPPQPDDGRQRDVFPLPLLQIEGEIAKKSMARSVQKRIERRRATQRRVNMAIAALNSMFHGGRYRGEPTYCSNLRSVPEVQRYVLNHIITRVKRCGGRPADASYSGAIDALRVSCGSYQDDTVGVGDTVCMELEILSLPCLSDSGVNLEGELNGDAGRALRHFEDEMLQDAPSWGRLGNEVSKVKPYNDPQLRHRGFYLKFLKRLQSCGILTFCARPRGRVGAFTVSKKPKFVDGVEKRRQRLILDCRQVNLQFRAPPLTELGSLASLCEAELHNNDILYTGGADIQDCFYACFMPKELTEFFCLSWDLSLEEAIAVGDGELPEASAANYWGEEQSHGYSDNPDFEEVPFEMMEPRMTLASSGASQSRSQRLITQVGAAKSGPQKRPARVLKGVVECPKESSRSQSQRKVRRTLSAGVSHTPPVVERQLVTQELGESDEESMAPRMTRLEKRSVSKAQRTQYLRYLNSFKAFCSESEETWPPNELDWTLADYFDAMFLDGSSHATGQKVLAAVEFAFIEKKGQLVRSRRALRGWQKLRPPQSRLPLPKPLAYGMAQIIMARGHREMGLKLVLDFDLYLRPSEGMDLLGKHVVAPVPGAGAQYRKYAVIIRDQDYGKPDKTGVYDNTLLLDNPATERWLGPTLRNLAIRRGKERLLFSFSQEEFRKEFDKAGASLGVNGLQTYQLRHGGASEDLNSRVRDHVGVRERGRWRTDTSVRRYAKTGKLQKLLQELEKPNLEYCRRSLQAEDNYKSFVKATLFSALLSPGSLAAQVAVCGLTVQRAQRCKHPRWGAAVPEEVLSTPPAQAEAEAVVIWLHGLGDTGQGWSTTAPALQQMGLPMLRFLFPTAPLRGIGSKGLRHSWYDVPTLDPDEISRQASPPGLLESAGDVLGLVEPHVRRGIPPNRIFLVGYSQGGGLALAAALRAPRRLGGVLMLSSWVAEPLPDDFKDVPVHIFHGAEDPVVPLSTAQMGRARLEAAGLRTTFRAYAGMTHGVCDEEVADLAQTFYESLL
ncbi:LYPLA1 [Symbiodinium microadriaticum]|nr:LYPLA1 [Symbiodinium sp. KB8]CAE7558338.1 LYPLA1 [Symbiodinium microadriaticum]